jgi:hypothetical protein
MSWKFRMRVENLVFEPNFLFVLACFNSVFPIKKMQHANVQTRPVNSPWIRINQWIGFRENLQETMEFDRLV